MPTLALAWAPLLELLTGGGFGPAATPYSPMERDGGRLGGWFVGAAAGLVAKGRAPGTLPAPEPGDDPWGAPIRLAPVGLGLGTRVPYAVGVFSRAPSFPCCSFFVPWPPLTGL